VDNNQSKVWQIPVGSIKPRENQPRRYFDPAELNELAESIKIHGIIQPILLSERADGGYEIIAGERRWRAAQIAGVAIMPAIIKSYAEREKLEVALVENIQRADLNPIEEAFAYKRLMDEFGLIQQEVADKVGKSRPALANAVRLLDLPEEAQKALMEKKINVGQARALLGIAKREDRLAMLSSMLGQKITVRELEREVRKKGGAQRRDPNLMYLEEKLRQALGTRVNITQKGERGTVAISYYSKEELGRVIKKITG